MHNMTLTNKCLMALDLLPVRWLLPGFWFKSTRLCTCEAWSFHNQNLHTWMTKDTAESSTSLGVNLQLLCQLKVTHLSGQVAMFQSDLIFCNSQLPLEPNLLVIYSSDPPKQGKPCHHQLQDAGKTLHFEAKVAKDPKIQNQLGLKLKTLKTHDLHCTFKLGQEFSSLLSNLLPTWAFSKATATSSNHEKWKQRKHLQNHSLNITQP